MSNRERDCRPSFAHDCPARPHKPVSEQLQTRESRLGEGLIIRRALPHRQRRLVGAWCFLDQAGPLEYGPGGGIAVGPHPHTGLQTFSWMIEGEIVHRDSLGFEQIIRPGQVNLMSAGRGIAHSEDAAGDGPGRLHLVQLWIALPDAEREGEPAFTHYRELPVVDRDGFRATVLVGSALGQASPVEVHTPLLGLDLVAKTAAATRIELNPDFEHGVLVLSGKARIDGQALEPGTLLYLGIGREELAVECEDGAHVLLIGGEPFDEDILLWWNFVARTPEEIERAAARWRAGEHFGEVVGSPSPRLEVPSLDGIRLKRSGR